MRRNKVIINSSKKPLFAENRGYPEKIPLAFARGILFLQGTGRIYKFNV
jgi:hypothetical protein